jgi:hypothetical protein
MIDRRSGTRLVAGLAVGIGGAVLLTRAFGSRGSLPVITYPPLDVPKPVDDDIWIVDSGPISASGLKLPVRMTVVRLKNGHLLLHSPTRFNPALADALAAFGEVRHLLAPSLAHWVFLAEWQRAFPNAKTWATPGLRERAQVRRSGLRIDVDLGEGAPADWSDEIAQGVVKGTAGFSETWFFHQTSRTLVLTDLVENLEPAKLTPSTSLLMRVTLATSGTAALHVRALLAVHGAAARMAIDAMLDFAPKRVIFSHGRWFDEDGEARLRGAFAWLPGSGSVSKRRD